MNIQVSRIHHPVTALGPGTRIGIWLQGCSIRCRGCISQDTWAAAGGSTTTVEQVTATCAALWCDDLSGVTISGGEPFDQPEPLLELLTRLRALWRDVIPAVDVLVYSGYTATKLRRRHGEIIRLCDALITGPFVASRPTRRLWRGSSNQELITVTGLGRSRYRQYEACEPERPPIQAAVDQGHIWYIGVPRAGDMARIDARLRSQGIVQRRPSWRP